MSWCPEPVIFSVLNWQVSMFYDLPDRVNAAHVTLAEQWVHYVETQVIAIKTKKIPQEIIRHRARVRFCLAKQRIKMPRVDSASGGKTYSRETNENVKLERLLNHPNDTWYHWFQWNKVHICRLGETLEKTSILTTTFIRNKPIYMSKTYKYFILTL